MDLIAYLDVDPLGSAFVAKPIQMKAASRRSFGVFRKYEKFHDLILAFVWHVDGESAPETYALTYDECGAVAEEMGAAHHRVMDEKGAYSTTQPGKRLCRLLGSYRMDAERWRMRLGVSCVVRPIAESPQSS